MSFIESLNQAVISASTEQISCNLGEESVILNFKDNTYYGLNTIGQKIWELIQNPKTICEIKDSILDEYKIEPDLFEKDLKLILEDLLTKGLIEIKHG